MYTVNSNSLGLVGKLGTHIEEREAEHVFLILIFLSPSAFFADSGSSRVGRDEWMTGKWAKAGAIYSCLLAVEISLLHGTLLWVLWQTCGGLPHVFLCQR